MTSGRYVVVLAWLIQGCPSPAPPAPPPDSTPDCAAACANVAARVPACPEGHYASCEKACAHVQSDPHMEHADLGHLAAATSPEQVRAAGWSCRIEAGAP